MISETSIHAVHCSQRVCMCFGSMLTSTSIYSDDYSNINSINKDVEVQGRLDGRGCEDCTSMELVLRFRISGDLR